MTKSVEVTILQPIGGMYNREPFPGVGETVRMREDDVVNFERAYLVKRVSETPEQKTATEKRTAESSAQAPEIPESSAPRRVNRRKAASQETE